MQGLMKKNERQMPKEGLQVPLDQLDDRQKGVLKWDHPGEFDSRVEIYDPVTGVLLKYQPYRYFVENGNAVVIRKDEKGVERRYGTNGKLLDQGK